MTDPLAGLPRVEMRAMAGRSLPDYIEQEFDAYLKCGRLV
jgi:hypothetical protein